MTEQWVATRRLADVRTGKIVNSEPSSPADVEAPYVTAANVQPLGRVIEVEGKSMWFTPKELAGSCGIRGGDLLVVEGGAGFGRPGIVPDDFNGWGFQNHINRIRPRDDLADTRFLYYAFEHLLSSGQTAVVAQGATLPTLSSEKVRALRVPYLTRERQREVACFLDHQTTQIDEVIEAQRELATVLEERRLAVIRRAVTRGIDGDASLAESGVKWLGGVPSHWQVGNIRRFALMKSGHTPSRQAAEYWVDCNIPWFTLADVHQIRSGRAVYLGDTTDQISRVGLANSAAELLPTGTVVLSRTASVGFSGIMPQPMATSQDFWNWVCGPDLTPEYLLFVFRAMAQEWQALRMGSTHQTIYQGDAAAISIPVPPLTEQHAIVAHVRQQMARTDDMIDAANQAIALMRERRAALISAAVTGRIDPRTGLEREVQG